MGTVRRRRMLGASVAIACAAVAAGQVLGRTSGSRSDERRRRFVGDGLVAHPNVVTHHGGTLPAPPAQVWPWLTQAGWHRGGWYTARWVDRVLFPENWGSAEHLDPRWVRDLQVGDTIPDGPPGTAEFVVQHVDPPHLLVLRSLTHVPASWTERTGARIDWVWTFALSEEAPGRTRMLIRTVARTDPWWLTLAYVAFLVPADHVMATSMLRGLSARVAAAAADGPGSGDAVGA